ncbi:hypothetical protein GGI04_002174 [Coemansia thaxteri]|nr:hypothetical protein GGI04_002174 [Coemansia thaxteri]KAJ2471713.1 hypothetical protein GGI02_002087 [Coemansia sp. RSA 2322]
MSQANSSATGAQSSRIHWVPLESSPEAMNRVIHRLGVDPSVGFSDVLGLDEELLLMTAQPVQALVFLFPLTDNFEESRKNEAVGGSGTVSPKVWFMRQTIGNACGTMAIMHALANTRHNLPISGHLAQFFEQVKDMSPEERAAVLESDSTIADAHKEGAATGQTSAPSPDADVDHHYSAFVCVDGSLYELDGRLSAPINHGPSTDVLRDGAQAIKRRIESFAGESQAFSVIALGPSSDEDDY